METRSIEDRRATLLDQLDNPMLTKGEIEKIRLKLELLDAEEA